MAQTWEELRISPRKGRSHPGAGRKLADSEASEIRERYYAGGVSGYELAAEYGISHTTIFSILSGKTYHGNYGREYPNDVRCIVHRRELPLGTLCPLENAELYAIGCAPRTAAHDPQAAIARREALEVRDAARDAADRERYPHLFTVTGAD